MARSKSSKPTLINERVAAYCRVSTYEQADRQTIQTQIDFLRKYLDLHGLDVHDFYLDDGVSGDDFALAERANGARLLADAAAGHFGSVIVYRLDRLGRNLRALLDAHDQLDQAGIAIRSATEPFDTSTPIGQFLFQLLGSLAELEKSTIVERMTLGRDRVVRGGKWTNGSLPVGYDFDADGRLVASARLLPDGSTEADMVRDLFRRIAAGSTLITESRRLEALGTPSVLRRAGRADVVNRRWWPTRLHKVIKHPVYKGEYTLQSRNGPVEMPVPALVDANLWEAAQTAMTRNRDLSRAGNVRDYLLRGIARCRSPLEDGSVCGRTYIGGPGSKPLPDGTRRLYYHCSGSRSHSTAPDRPRCPGRSVPMATLEQLVWEDVRAFVLAPDRYLADARAALAQRSGADSTTGPERERLATALASKAAERERAQLLFRRGLADLDETERALRAVDADVEQLRALLAALDADLAATQATAAYLDETALLVGSLHPLVESGDAGDQHARRTVIELLVREVSIATALVAPTGRQKRPQKRVRVTVRYLYSPSSGRSPVYGSIPQAKAWGILPDNLPALSITIERELTLV